MNVDVTMKTTTFLATAMMAYSTYASAMDQPPGDALFLACSDNLYAEQFALAESSGTVWAWDNTNSKYYQKCVECKVSAWSANVIKLINNDESDFFWVNRSTGELRTTIMGTLPNGAINYDAQCTKSAMMQAKPAF